MSRIPQFWRNYPLEKLGAFIRATGHEVFAHWLYVPLTKNWGFTVGFVQRVPAPTPEDQSDD